MKPHELASGSGLRVLLNSNGSIRRMDCGGLLLERLFRRAESAANFGREIALMYTHAHLRFAEAMARWGDAEALFLALRQANPIAIRALLRGARPRQANCYYTSSDVVFADRYEAQARYAELRSGEVEFEGAGVFTPAARVWPCA